MQADYSYWQGRFQPLLTLGIDDEGRWVSPDEALLPDAAGSQTVRLCGRALLPGLVNAHSHAFQRLLRGRTEYVAVNSGASTAPASPDRETPAASASTGLGTDNFWSWREAMYRTAHALDPDALYVASRQAFLEMILSGITAVGEFHYLHHAPDGTPYANPNEMALAVVRAAREVGLRIVLLRVGYARAGKDTPLKPHQLRFVDRDPEAWFTAAQGLRTSLADDSAVTIGLAPHSVRALPLPWLEAVAALRGAERGPVHMHVAEQPAEVTTCLAEYGLRPVELLQKAGLLGPHFTAVHGIQLDTGEMAALGRSGSHVCACPLTERNLGDGVVPADALRAAGVPICLGSDSQAQIDLLEEARALDGQLRLIRGRRAVLDPGGGLIGGLAQQLLESATVHGARALGLAGGEMRAGQPADFFTLDLNHPSLAGVREESLLPELLFGAPSGAVRDVAVDGDWRVRDGRHPNEERIGRDYAALNQTLRE